MWESIFHFALGKFCSRFCQSVRFRHSLIPRPPIPVLTQPHSQTSNPSFDTVSFPDLQSQFLPLVLNTRLSSLISYPSFCHSLIPRLPIPIVSFPGLSSQLLPQSDSVPFLQGIAVAKSLDCEVSGTWLQLDAVFLSVFQVIAALASSPDTTQCDLGDEQNMLLKGMYDVTGHVNSSALCFLRF